MIVEREPWSYRDDPAVPDFPDAGPVLFVDGECTLCSIWARIVARADRREEFRLAPVQRPLGRAMLVHYGLDPDDPESWLCLIDGRATSGIEGIAATFRRFGGPWRIGAWLMMLPPKGMRDWLYRRIARNRYALLGRTEMCALPDPRLRARILE
jgi:predicted DCC family thiol-disulfide oxidoreductase YuxK